MKNIIPVVMAGVLGIYGLIIAVILIQGGSYTQHKQGTTWHAHPTPPILKPHTIYLLALFLFSTCSVKPPYSSFSGYAHLSAGLSCGLSGLGAGLAIGIVGDAGVRANGIQPKLFVPMVLILIFAEALGLYGLIVGIILSQQTQTCTVPTL